MKVRSRFAGAVHIAGVPVQKHDGECAIEQKNDLPRETARFVGGPDFLQHDAEPVLDPLLVRAAREDRRMSRQVDELDRRPQEPAPPPLGMPRRRRQIAENALHLVRRVALGLGEPALEQRKVRLVARFEIGGDQVVLAAEVIIERSLGKPGLFGDRVDAHGADAFRVEQLPGCLNDALACRSQ